MRGPISSPPMAIPVAPVWVDGIATLLVGAPVAISTVVGSISWRAAGARAGTAIGSDMWAVAGAIIMPGAAMPVVPVLVVVVAVLVAAAVLIAPVPMPMPILVLAGSMGVADPPIGAPLLAIPAPAMAAPAPAPAMAADP